MAVQHRYWIVEGKLLALRFCRCSQHRSQVSQRQKMFLALHALNASKPLKDGDGTRVNTLIDALVDLCLWRQVHVPRTFAGDRIVS